MAKKKRQPDELGFDFGRQIVCDQRQKSLLAALNHLKAANVGDYCEVHGKYSLIQILMQDYSKGKGDKSVYVKYNLSAENVKAIHHIVSSFYPLYPQSDFKERFYKEFEQDFSELSIVRSSQMNNPWSVVITNGKCKKQGNKNIPIKGSTFTVKQFYTDRQFFELWSTIYTFVCNWEMSTQTALYRKGYPMTERAVNTYNSEQKSNGQANQQYRGRNQQYNNVQPNYQTQPQPPRVPQGQQVQNNYSRQQQPQQRQQVQNNRQQQTNRGNNVLPPPLPIEDEVPFEQMPAYGTQRNMR